MHHFKLSAYNSNVQRKRKQIQKKFKKICIILNYLHIIVMYKGKEKRKQKNLKKSIDILKLSAYNSNIQEIRKK